MTDFGLQSSHFPSPVLAIVAKQVAPNLCLRLHWKAVKVGNFKNAQSEDVGSFCPKTQPGTHPTATIGPLGSRPRACAEPQAPAFLPGDPVRLPDAAHFDTGPFVISLLQY